MSVRNDIKDLQDRVKRLLPHLERLCHNTLVRAFGSRLETLETRLETLETWWAGMASNRTLDKNIQAGIERLAVLEDQVACGVSGHHWTVCGESEPYETTSEEYEYYFVCLDCELRYTRMISKLTPSERKIVDAVFGEK